MTRQARDAPVKGITFNWDDEELEQPEPVDTGDNKEKRKQGKRNHHSPQEKKIKVGASHCTTKKCNCCKKTLDIGQFNEGQAKCKPCNNDLRTTAKALATAMGDKWLDEARTKKPELVEGIQKQLIVKKRELAKEGKSLKNMPMRSFVEKLEAEWKEGVLDENPMLWKGAYAEWAKSAAGGYLQPEEIDAQWDKWEKDPDHPRDWRGPRGSFRLAVLNHTTKVTKFQGVTETKGLQRAGNISKSVGDDELARMAQVHLSSSSSKLGFGEISKQLGRNVAMHGTVEADGRSSLLQALGSRDNDNLADLASKAAGVSSMDAAACEVAEDSAEEDVEDDPKAFYAVGNVGVDGRWVTKKGVAFDALKDKNALRRPLCFVACLSDSELGIDLCCCILPNKHP